jgi:hypothetical protein
MAKIADTKGRADENSGYIRLLGSRPLGLLISRLHATVIRSGNELERLLEQSTPSRLRTTLPHAIRVAKSASAAGVQTVFSPKIRKRGAPHGITGDVVLFDHGRKHISVIEVKDGDTFDTKKASGELESMRLSAAALENDSGYSASIFFCSFNQPDKEAIVMGAKGRFSPQQVMTGRELCDIPNIDYEAFTAKRRSEQLQNLDYFLDQLASIPELRERLRRILE